MPCCSLRDEGNTVIVVEHDLLVMRAADHLIDMGPGRARAAGRVVAQGTPGQVARPGHPHCRLAARRAAHGAAPMRSASPSGWLTIRGARANNLRARLCPAAGRAGGRVRRLRLGQEHAGDRHAGAGAGAAQADHLGGLRAGRARRARAHRRRAGARPAGRPVGAGVTSPAAFPRPRRRAAARCSPPARMPRRWGWTKQPGAALLGLRRDAG